MKIFAKKLVENKSSKKTSAEKLLEKKPLKKTFEKKGWGVKKKKHCGEQIFEENICRETSRKNIIV